MKKTYLTFAIVLAGLLPASADDFFRQTDAGNNSTGNNWNDTGNYFSQPGSGGTNPTQMTGNDFFNAGFNVRASGGNSASSTTFAGDSLNLDGGSLLLRVGDGGTATVANLTSDGTTILSNDNNASITMTLAVNTFTNNELTLFNANTGTDTGIFVDIDTLVGSGGFEFVSTAGNGAQRFVELSVLDATGFSGDLTWMDDPGNNDAVQLRFGNDLVMEGSSLIAAGDNQINLDQDVTFGGLSLDGDTLAVGTYDFAFLNANYDSLFVDGGSGSITVVPEPATGALVLGGLGLLAWRRRRG
ncbi:MAG: PEP-CTERM sorting domain-containing protein [Verrucomicrobiota bacterium]